MYTWDFRHLNPFFSKEFKWVYSQTPLSDLSVIYAGWITYFIGIIGLRWYMAERTRVERSNVFLVFYNLSMIICSAFIWYSSSIAIWFMVKHNGMDLFTHCHAAEYQTYSLYGGYLIYSVYLMYILRYYVFLDTVILVLRKKSIPFLHWYQHMCVILMMWSWLQDQSIFGSLATSIISLVQIFRYCYYFGCCINLQDNLIYIKCVACFFEFIQFIAGLVLTVYQMSLCPQSNSVLLSSSINVTMVYMVVKFYDTSDGSVNTRDHYKRRISQRKDSYQ